jgi:hypothetical protein
MDSVLLVSLLSEVFGTSKIKIFSDGHGYKTPGHGAGRRDEG